jgi:RNA polymerase-binding transcription factor DksA
MPQPQFARPAAVAGPAAGIRAPRWRALLEARWRARLQEVIELSLAYHAEAASAASAAPARDAGAGQPEARQLVCRKLLCRASAARRKLADVEEALGRLAAGTFGRCEQCGSGIPDGLLAITPERRYCPRCEAEAEAGPALAPPGHVQA